VRILLVHPSADLYGSDRMVAIAADALVDRGHAVTVILAAHGPLVERVRQSGAVVTVTDTPVLRKSDLSVRGFLKLLFKVAMCQISMGRAVYASDPDVVYINTIVQPWWIIASKVQRRRVVVHVREAETEVMWLLKKIIYAPLLLADAIICNSKSTHRDIVEALPMSGRKAKVIYNGKDWTAYQISTPGAGRGNGVDSVRLTVVGRLSPRKGQDLAVRALAKLVSSGHEVTLTLVGDVFTGYEWYEDELKRLAVELSVSDRINFAGFQNDIQAVLEGSDIAIVPSRIEPFGTVAAECMAAGLPTIVADVHGLAEIVENGKTGLTFEMGDSDALADCCHWVISHSDQSQQIALAGQQSISDRFSLKQYQAKIISTLEDVSAADRS
jgi:glycosyltransferase involved in cell wall biosynthesis